MVLYYIQIEGEIKAARDALVEVTSRLRIYLYKEFFQKDTPPSISALGMEADSPNNTTPACDSHSGGEPPAPIYQNMRSVATSAQQSKVIVFHG